MIAKTFPAAMLAGTLAVVGLLPAAQAADLAKAYPVKAPVVVPVFSWTGLYVGVNVGGAWTSSTSSYDLYPFAYLPGASMSPDGWFGGIQAGYNYQFSNNVVLGVEADVQIADISDTVADTAGGPPNTLTAKSQSFGTIRARLGYAFDRVLPYITGGAAWANSKIEATDGPLEDSATAWGWTIGGGVEYALTNNWTVRAEYLYSDLGSVTYFEGQPWQSTASSTSNLVRAAVNYKF